jgi:hypothetical protein
MVARRQAAGAAARAGRRGRQRRFGNAFRPLDVIRSRKGLTVEIGNTDAEGRLILADALPMRSTKKPALLSISRP